MGAETLKVQDKLFIGGEWVTPATDGTIDVVGASTEQVIGRVPDGSPGDIDRAVAAARAAFDHGPWAGTSAGERADAISRLSAALLARQDDFASTITAENGTPISMSAMMQVFPSTSTLDFYAGLAREFPFEEPRTGMLGNVLVRREPLGVVGAIVPWNVPLFTACLKLGPALAAGCTVVLKPAPETGLDALLLAEVVDEVGLPPGVVNIVTAGRQTGEHLVTHPDVDKIAFTGSTAAGVRIATLCAERLRPVTLELGGKSAAIVLDDADLTTAATQILPMGAMMFSGQACIAQTRILAPRSRYDETVDALCDTLRSLPVGDPFDPQTVFGPLVSSRRRERVEAYIALGQDEGAKVAVGGGRPADLPRGWYVEPTVFSNVDNAMRIAREEIFGPVAVVIPYEDEDDAVRIANDSDYGLGGGVYTSDPSRGVAVARRVRTGTISLNGISLEFGAPFGGYKRSGLGRELGPEGLHAYLEAKTIMNVPDGS